jgi:hypothetical protein
MSLDMSPVATSLQTLIQSNKAISSKASEKPEYSKDLAEMIKNYSNNMENVCSSIDDFLKKKELKVITVQEKVDLEQCLRTLKSSEKQLETVEEKQDVQTWSGILPSLKKIIWWILGLGSRHLVHVKNNDRELQKKF